MEKGLCVRRLVLDLRKKDIHRRYLVGTGGVKYEGETGCLKANEGIGRSGGVGGGGGGGILGWGGGGVGVVGGLGTFLGEISSVWEEGRGLYQGGCTAEKKM